MLKTKKAEKKRRMKELECLTDEQYFQRDTFLKYMRSVMSSLISAFRSRKITLSLYMDEAGSTAMTDGNNVGVNILNPLMEYVHTRTEKFLVLLGMLTHECGHLLFTDFTGWNKFFQKFEKEGKLDDVIGVVKEEPSFEAMMHRFSEEPGLIAYALPVLMNIENIFEDGYIENRLKRTFAGLPRTGLRRTREILYNMHPSLDELMEDEEQTMLNILITAFFLMIGDGDTSGYVKGEGEAMGYDRYREFDLYMSSCRSDAQALLFERDPRLRRSLVARIFAQIFPLIDELYEPKEEGSESGENSEGEPDEGDPSENEAPGKGGSGEGEPGESEGKPEKGSKNPLEGLPITAAPMPNAKGKPTKADEMALEHIEDRMMRREEGEAESPDLDDTESAAIAELDAEQTEEELKVMAEEAFDLDRTYNIERKAALTPQMRSAYAEEFAEVKAASKKAIRLMNSVLKEREREGRMTGQLYGKRVDCRTAYRGDGRIFTRRLVPDGTPNVAFCILIDESGSMGCGKRISSARKSAICLENVLREMDIPFAIVGHSADISFEREVNIFPYVRFGELDPDDRYRLAGCTARVNNHDEAAMRYCGKLLEARPENKKVMIVISDGQPAASCYGGYPAVRHAHEYIEQLSKKGIETFGAAIDGCASEVAEIYGNNRLMDISDLDRLPVELMKVVKRYVLRRQA